MSEMTWFFFWSITQCQFLCLFVFSIMCIVSKLTKIINKYWRQRGQFYPLLKELLEDAFYDPDARSNANCYVTSTWDHLSMLDEGVLLFYFLKSARSPGAYFLNISCHLMFIFDVVACRPTRAQQDGNPLAMFFRSLAPNFNPMVCNCLY